MLICVGVINEYKNELYQLKVVDVDMLNTVKNYRADVSSVSPSSEKNCSDEGLTNSSRCLTYPHQLSVDTIHGFTPKSAVGIDLLGTRLFNHLFILRHIYIPQKELSCWWLMRLDLTTYY